MTKKEFIKRKQSWQKRTLTCAAIFMLFYSITGGGILLLGQSTAVNGSAHWVGNALLCALVLLILCSLPFALWMHQHLVRGFQLVCHGCGKSLVGAKTGKNVIATGTCSFCGERVFDNDPDV